MVAGHLGHERKIGEVLSSLLRSHSDLHEEKQRNRRPKEGIGSNDRPSPKLDTHRILTQLTVCESEVQRVGNGLLKLAQENPAGENAFCDFFLFTMH